MAKQNSSRLNWWLARVLPVLFLVGVICVIYLDVIIRAQFEGKRWSLPAHVFARPLELYVGLHYPVKALLQELEWLGYRRVAQMGGAGTFSYQDNKLEITTRGFPFWDGDEPSQHVVAEFSGDAIIGLQAPTSGKPAELIRLEPLRIGGVYPAHNEDRILVKREEVPAKLIDLLMVAEDRDFYDHIGVSPKAIVRALWVNFMRGSRVQGGSTLTQQLVKNYFLTQERTISRKLREVVMALLLERRYDKDDILEAYLNEVNLGQDGRRAIHGFGLASHFYFGRPLNELRPSQWALLVAMVRGPSHYNPKRHPERAKDRRNLVLQMAYEQELLTQVDYERAVREPLGVVSLPQPTSRYPAFMDLVRRQLHQQYAAEMLTTEGLQIFTTLDPWIQQQAEEAMAQKLIALRPKGELLQGAMVVTQRTSGEVLALVGSRLPEHGGFNRALDAVRPIGSLVKPAVYLAALQEPDHYQLNTLISDTPLSIQATPDQLWEPKNYDGTFHGQVLLYQALAKSYNVATVRLGLDVGLPKVVDTLTRLGVRKDIPAYPSLLLGAIELSPFEVATMYQTLATGGLVTPLRSIREVTTAEHQAIARYPLAVQRSFEPGPLYLVSAAMQSVVQEGTAAGLSAYVPLSTGVAGKTGTTDDLRDSWFAGFTGDYVGVAWVGRDSNKPTGLTGATGAMQVWGEVFAKLAPKPLKLSKPSNIEYGWVRRGDGMVSESTCNQAVALPFFADFMPEGTPMCGEGWFANQEDQDELESETIPATSGSASTGWFREFLDW